MSYHPRPKDNPKDKVFEKTERLRRLLLDEETILWAVREFGGSVSYLHGEIRHANVKGFELTAGFFLWLTEDGTEVRKVTYEDRPGGWKEATDGN